MAQAPDDSYVLIPTSAINNTLFWGVLGGALSATTATISVTPLTAIYGKLPGSAITASNTAGLTAQDDSLVLVAGDPTGANYYILRVRPACCSGRLWEPLCRPATWRLT